MNTIQYRHFYKGKNTPTPQSGDLSDHHRWNSYVNDWNGDLIDQAQSLEMFYREEAINEFCKHREIHIAHAIERDRQGKGNICEVCEKPIPKSRRIAQPEATRCIECQIKYEKECKRTNSEA